MSTSTAASASHLPALPEAFWPLRWFGEMEAPLFDTGGSALEGEEKNLLALATAAARPWTLMEAQLAIPHLTLLRVGAAQAEWMDAWSKTWGGVTATASAEHGDRWPALSFDPFAMPAQAQAFIGNCIDGWAALARSGPIHDS